MKKFLMIVGIILVGIVVMIAIALKILGNMPAAPEDYQKSISTGGDIEKLYMANGGYDVSFHEQGLLQVFEKILVYYPSELETSSKKYPVIVVCNGSGTPLSRYSSVARHLASWGFIVIGTEEKYSWNALGAEICLRYLERLDQNETIENTRSLFYHKVDFDNVGVVGHSQGGVGVINAITATEHMHTYKAAVSLSPTNKELAHNLFWDYDACKVNTPILLLSGEGGGDDWVVTSEQLDQIYEDIPCSRIKARRRNTVHGEMLYSSSGYVVAWFRWLLQGDSKAAAAFVGDHPEIMSNENYVDQMLDFIDR